MRKSHGIQGVCFAACVPCSAFLPGVSHGGGHPGSVTSIPVKSLSNPRLPKVLVAAKKLASLQLVHSPGDIPALERGSVFYFFFFIWCVTYHTGNNAESRLARFPIADR